MSIWGQRDSEPQAGETHESPAAAYDTQEPAAAHQAGEHQAEESAPAFWRAQGETPGVSGREPADAPPLAAYGQQASSDAAEPAVSESAAGTDAPVPVLTGEVVVLDGETAVKDPALPGPGGDQAGMYEADAVDPDVTEARIQEPVAAEAGAQEPVAAEAAEPAVAGAHEPVLTEAQAGPRDSGIPAQRWSEILVAFVDDPRSSVEMAAGAVDEAIDEFVNSVRARQRALASTWQSAGAETEQLRTALRDYRKLGQRVQQLDLGEKTGA
jgi:hypothetical protein